MIKLKAIRGYLIDLDGTTYLGNKLLPGAMEFVEYLYNNKIPFIFLSNNSSQSEVEYYNKLKKFGLSISKANILTSGTVMIQYLRRINSKARLFVLGTNIFKRQIKESGFIITSSTPDFIVVAFDKTLTYKKLERACLLINKGVPYIATHPDMVCPTEYGDIPDCGAILALIKAATQREPAIVLGKPHNEMIDTALERLGTKPYQTAMVGDRLYTDMKMAKMAKLTGILLLSGETKVEN